MADEVALRDIGKDLELSPPKLEHKTTAWWIHQLSNTNQDSLLNRVDSMPSLAPAPDPWISASTQQAEYLVDAQAKPPNTGPDSLSTGTSAASAADSRKRKGKGECINLEDPADICIVKQEDGSPFKRKKIFRETHNLSERKRRAKINEQLQNLQELIPPGNTASQASLLERAVGYIKSLKVLLQMLSMMSPENAKAIQQYQYRRFA